MAANKMDEILKHFPDLEEGWKEMEEKLKAEPAEREMLSLKYREMLQRESLEESLVESEFTKAKREGSDLKVMKANAPEKIYLFENPITETPDDRWLSKRSGDEDIEYTRTDAFIEKACEWLRNNYLQYPSEDCADTTKFVMDFKNYMKRD